MKKRALTAVVAAALVVTPHLVSVIASAEAPAAAAAPPEVPAGFQDIEAIPGLSESTAVAFAPDGTAFVGLKPGVVKAFDYNAGTGQWESFANHTEVASLVANVHNYHDRGLTGVAVDPQFGTAGHNYVYVNYAYDRDPRDNPAIVPKWGTGGGGYDDCAAPAAMGPPVVTGCVGVTRVSRIPVTKGANGWVGSGPEEPLVNLTGGEAACQQFGSHASGDVVFGPDGMLYASAGDGASFDSLDYGQAGNPCGDPVNEGGGLRSQDIRTSGDPLGLGGTIFRINPNGGQVASGAQANASRIVTYGQRNPWRLTFRPGTNELWSADVGASGWEEVNRTDMSTFSSPVNLGWPCYEGAYFGVQKQAGWDALDKPICENLYAAEASSPGTVKAPWFSYQTRGSTGPLTPGEHCEQGTSSISGVAFIPTTSTYPAQYRGAMFFNDFARSCVWLLGKKANGDPDPTQILPFVQRAESPVQIKVGPGGDLYYVDYGVVDGNVVAGAGGIHRIVYTTGNHAPLASITATPSAGPAPLNVTFNAGGSSDQDGDALTYAWDLDGNGSFETSGGATQSRTYSTPGNVTVSVQVSDGRGGTDSKSVVVSPGNSPPQITSMLPNASFTWSAGQTVNLTATATDAQQTLPDGAFSWSVILQHCPSVCHTHPLTGGVGKAVSFTTVGHEYPSNLLVTLTVTDAQGLTDIETVELDPKTADLTFVTNPAGGAMTIAGAGVFSGHTQRFIQGSTVDVAVPDTRVVNGANYTFSSWSDGGARSHSFNAPTSNATITATYARQNRLPTVTLSANPTSGTAPLTVDFSTSATDPDGDDVGFTYEWALDGDGLFNDGGGATKSKQFTTSGTKTVQVRVTDSHGGQDTDQVSVDVGAANQPPAAALSANPTSGNAPLAVSFSAAGSSDPDSDPLTYEWALDGDGQFNDGGGTTKSKTFTTPGAFTVQVRVSDGHGGSDTEQVTITVNNRPPVAALSATPTSGNAPLVVNLNAGGSTDPDGDPLTYEWALDPDGLFNDGGGSTRSKTFSTPGTFTVQVRVSDGRGGTDTEPVTITVANRPPVASATATPSSGTVPLAVSFNASASSDPDGDPLTYEWALDADGLFNDGGGATKSKTYNSAGPVDVKVRVSDGRGASDVATVRVSPGTRNPEGIVYASPGDAGQAPLTTTFFAEFTDPDGDPLTYRWDLDEDGDFDDGGTAATQQATFTKVGVNRVFVQVDDPDGGQWIAFATIQVLNTNPTVTIAAAPQTGATPLTTTLTATAVDPDVGALSYAWDLDDDGEYDDGTGLTRTTSFTTLGAHVVGIEVTDADGGRGTGTTTVTVTAKPPPRGTLSIKVKPTDLDVKIDGVSRPHGWSSLFDVGSSVKVAAPKKQRIDGVLYQFVRWSDGRKRQHRVVITVGTLVLKAIYKRQR
jgi:PKD repeat protein/glucose/arabinose dehydrogenase